MPWKFSDEVLKRLQKFSIFEEKKIKLTYIIVECYYKGSEGLWIFAMENFCIIETTFKQRGGPIELKCLNRWTENEGGTKTIL